MFGFPAAVYGLTLPHEMLLGVIGGVEGRGEREVIVNPRRCADGGRHGNSAAR